MSTPPTPAADPARQLFVVCGDNALAVRLVDELATRYGVAVTMVVREAAQIGPAVAATGTRVVEAPRLTAPPGGGRRLTVRPDGGTHRRTDAGENEQGNGQSQLKLVAFRAMDTTVLGAPGAGSTVLLRPCLARGSGSRFWLAPAWALPGHGNSDRR